MRVVLYNGQPHRCGLKLLTRPEIAREIGIVVQCYRMDVNPLPQLRKELPNFDWNFWDLRVSKEPRVDLLHLVRSSDIFWMIGNGVAFVTAKNNDFPNRPAQKMFGSCPLQELSDTGGNPDLADELIRYGAIDIT
jgi:hypothetical protein